MNENGSFERQQVSKSRLFDAMTSIFVQHPRLDAAMEEIRVIVESGPYSNEPPCCHLSGPSGVGKSTLFKRFLLEYPPEKDACSVPVRRGPPLIADRRKLLQFTVPETPTLRSICETILKAYGDANFDVGETRQLIYRIDVFSRACETSVWLVDEGQRLVDRSGIVVVDHIVDFFRSRHAGGVAIILLGMGRLRFLFEQDGQVERRWTEELRFGQYQWWRPDGSAHEEDRATYGDIVATFAAYSPLPFSSEIDIEDDEVIFRFFYASFGLVGILTKILGGAMLIAARKDRSHAQVDYPLLREAFEKAIRREKHLMAVTGADGAPAMVPMQNPFDPGFAAGVAPIFEDDYRRHPTLAQKRRTKKRELAARLNDAFGPGR